MNTILLRCSAVLGLSALLLAGCDRLTRQSDEQVQTSIQAKMFTEPLLKTSSLRVWVRQGVVTLSGDVPDEATRRSAESLVSTTPGVKKIIDQTMIRPPQTLQPEEPSAPSLPSEILAPNVVSDSSGIRA